jgi:hypothetical protein
MSNNFNIQKKKKNFQNHKNVKNQNKRLLKKVYKNFNFFIIKLNIIES